MDVANAGADDAAEAESKERSAWARARLEDEDLRDDQLFEVLRGMEGWGTKKKGKGLRTRYEALSRLVDPDKHAEEKGAWAAALERLRAAYATLAPTPAATPPKRAPNRATNVSVEADQSGGAVTLRGTSSAGGAAVLTDEHADAAVACLRRVGAVATLQLRGHELGDRFADALAQLLRDQNRPRAGALNVVLRSNKLTDEGCAHLATALGALASLNLYDNRAITPAGAVALAEAARLPGSRLRELNLSGPPLHVPSLRGAPKVLALSFAAASSAFTDLDAAFAAPLLRENRCLTSLCLSSGRLTKAGAAALAEVIEHNATLLVLRLDHNAIGDEGATALARALEHNATLRQLGLCGTGIGDQGALALARALHGRRCLRQTRTPPVAWLCLTQNSAGEVALEQVRRAWASMADGCRPRPPDGLSL